MQPIHEGFHSRGYLPHIKFAGAAYFVTFRLADSLPREAMLRLKEQRDHLLRRAMEMHQDETNTRGELHAWYAAEVDSILDQHTGAAWLREPRIARLVATALRHFEGERYTLHAWCVMPNHVHVVTRPLGNQSLERILHSWKSYTATQANKLLDRLGRPFWQTESYDHWIRDDVDLAHCCRYTEENAAKAGLCAAVGDWPWSSAAKK
jgi:REP element-mobilizing transposase RayT